jgi:hypothetical protein
MTAMGERMEATMNKRILQGMLAGVFCAALAGAATGQIMAAMSADDAADAKSSLTRAGGDTTPPPAPADAKSDSEKMTTAKSESDSKSAKKSESDNKTAASSSKNEKPAQHARANSTTDKKSAHHAAKSTGDQSAKSDEKAFRQALRGCAERQDQTQRDSCLDEAIEKFQRG